MAHHGLSDMERLAQQYQMAQQATRINELIEHMRPNDAGPTGNFPDGKLDEQDEGEIMVGITSIENRVIMNFGKPIKWIGFTREQAKQIAESLLKHADLP